jgi:hypothetical protein
VYKPVFAEKTDGKHVIIGTAGDEEYAYNYGAT